MKRISVWGACAVLWGACSDEVNPQGMEIDGTYAYAVHLSDRESAGVALLDAEGKVGVSKYISSGSAVPGLSAALSGDIWLPTHPCDPNRLTLLARKGGDYLLQIDLANREVALQLKTHGSNSDGAYESNPQDILCLPDGRALISRYEPNLTPNPPAIDRGDDLIVVSLEDETLERRVDLAAFRGEVTTAGQDGNVTEPVYARPSVIIRVGDYALVGLSRLSPSWASDGKGMLALVRLSDFSVSALEMPTLVNCGELVPVAARDDAALVMCAGSPYGDRATSGVAVVAVREGKAEVETVFQAQDSLPALFSGAVSLGGTRALLVAQDYVAETPDEAFDVDLATGEGKPVFRGEATGDIGSGWFAAERGILLVPDIGVGVRRFEVSEDGFEELEPAELSATLPARTVRPIR